MLQVSYLLSSLPMLCENTKLCEELRCSLLHAARIPFVHAIRNMSTSLKQSKSEEKEQGNRIRIQA